MTLLAFAEARLLNQMEMQWGLQLMNPLGLCRWQWSLSFLHNMILLSTFYFTMGTFSFRNFHPAFLIQSLWFRVFHRYKNRHLLWVSWLYLKGLKEMTGEMTVGWLCGLSGPIVRVSILLDLHILYYTRDHEGVFGPQSRIKPDAVFNNFWKICVFSFLWNRVTWINGHWSFGWRTEGISTCTLAESFPVIPALMPNRF